MALLHRAELHPTKLELLAAWLPSRPWYQRRAGDLVRVAGYRFDDPAGAVGIETMLVRAGGGPVHQVPLTYRGAPLDGADGWLVGTIEHSVLGPRWVYDACGDPVYAAALAAAILAGVGQAQEYFEVDGRREHREPTMAIAVTGAEGGSGGVRGAGVPDVGPLRRVVDDDPTRIVTDHVELAVVRRLDGGANPAGTTPAGTTPAATTLTGAWSDQPVPLPLAYAAPR